MDPIGKIISTATRLMAKVFRINKMNRTGQISPDCLSSLSGESLFINSRIACYLAAGQRHYSEMHDKRVEG